MNNNQFDYLVPEITKKLIKSFFDTLKPYPEFANGSLNTSPLLNMTLGAFIGALVSILDGIKTSTIGEVKLIHNIELTKNTIMKAIEDLPFINKVEFIN